MDRENKISGNRRFFIVFASVIGLMLLVCMVVALSFQDGASSTNETISIAAGIANRIYGNPTQMEIEAVSLMIRYGAHLGLFFIVGMMTTFVGMVIFKKYFRIIGVVLAWGICYMLAYYTEYYKQFIVGRHFQQPDVVLNRFGSTAGIVCMIISYFLNRLLVRLSS